MAIPRDCSWVWRHILQARERAKDCIEYLIAEENNTSIWHAPWCRGMIVSDSAIARESIMLPTNAKVSALINEGKWNSLVTDIQDHNSGKQFWEQK
ncbi:hypothetical protein ACHQM5_007805 [Ranunculus cassubicifolius]